MSYEKKPLYRKFNTKSLGNHHHKGKNYRYERNKKTPDERMTHGEHRGLDYTPLFKFLLSKVGSNYNEVYSEVITRIPSKEPIYWMIIEKKEDSPYCFRPDENAYFSNLYVDQNNILQKIKPDLTVNDIRPHCTCCTHTLNGKVIPNKE